MRILFVDDMPDTRDVFSLAFSLLGHSARLAGNGAEAVAAVVEEEFDAIIMDVEMPEMNGWEAVRKIRALEAGQSHVPIIMFTAYANEEDTGVAQAVGADSLLRKPILPQELLAEIARVVSAQPQAIAK